MVTWQETVVPRKAGPWASLGMTDLKRNCEEGTRDFPRGECCVVVIVMGVTGVGKTTVGELLAVQLGWEFADADSFHSAANVEKMRQGIPLDDADRGPWLQAMRDAITRWIAEKRNVALACSALKAAYRQELFVSGDVKFVYLKGSYELI